MEGRWGRKGSPWELNLRDVFRWCDLLIKHQVLIDCLSLIGVYLRLNFNYLICYNKCPWKLKTVFDFLFSLLVRGNLGSLYVLYTATE